MSHNKLLTIAIPTYNRNNTLKDNLSILLPQLRHDIEILIIDNNSDIPVSETLRQEIINYTNLNIIRNNNNLGLCGNIIKCFEYCNSSWMWLLSDDDKASEKAIDIIIKTIKNNDDVNYINFKSSFSKKRTFDTTNIGVNSFIQNLDDINNLFLISTGVYNLQAITPFVRFAYLFSYSLVPHVVMLMISLNEHGKSLYSKEQIIYNNLTVDVKGSWSFSLFTLGISTIIYELPVELSHQNHKKLNNALLAIIGSPVSQLIRLSYQQKYENHKMLQYLFEQSYSRFYNGIPTIWKIEHIFCKVFLINSRTLKAFNYIIKHLKSLLKRQDIDYGVERFNRL